MSQCRGYQDTEHCLTSMASDFQTITIQSKNVSQCPGPLASSNIGESLSKILPRPLRSRMLRSSKLVLNACQKNFKRNEISRGALTENDGIKNVEINEIMPVNMIRRASDWIEATRETTEVRDEDEDQSRDDEDSTNLGNFLQHGHEHASRHRPDDFLPINGFSSETGLKSLHYSDNEFDYHLLNIWP